MSRSVLLELVDYMSEKSSSNTLIKPVNKRRGSLLYSQSIVGLVIALLLPLAATDADGLQLPHNRLCCDSIKTPGNSSRAIQNRVSTVLLQSVRGGGGGGRTGLRRRTNPRLPRRLVHGLPPSLDSRSSSDSNEDPSVILPSELFQRQGMAAALFATYFTVMGAKCALPSVLSQLTSPKIGLSFATTSISSPQQHMSHLLLLSTVAVAVGKLVLGPLIDRFGGVLSLQVCLTSLAALLTIISSCSTFTTFCACWILVDFIFSSCWAACINAIHQAFPEPQWASRVGMLAAAARMGNASAFAIFAWVLQWSQSHLERPWRLVFAVSAIIQIVPISLLMYFGRRQHQRLQLEQGADNIPAVHPSFKKSLETVRRESTTPAFWLHLVNRASLMVFGSFLLFVPTLMAQCYGVTPAQGAQIGSIFAIGCLLAVSTGSKLYTKFNRRGKVALSMALMGTSLSCTLAHLAHVTGRITMTVGQATTALFLWGFSFAVPFYIPASLYALNVGGKECSATIADIFDFVGFGLLAAFNGYVASIRHNVLSAWIPTFQLLTLCASSSMVSLATACMMERRLEETDIS